MTEKKTQSKRTNGTAKGKLEKAETNKTATKPRTRKPSPIPPGERTTSMLTDEEIACQAYALWEDRGRPLGSPDEDWYKAKEQLHKGER
jgi:hypothetical protein